MINWGSLSLVSSWSSYMLITGLHPQSPCHFTQQVSVWVSQNIWSSYLSHMIAATIQADKYWHLHHSDRRNTLTYVHMTPHNLATCNTSLGSLMLPVPEAGDFAELLLLYYNYRYNSCYTRRFCFCLSVSY